MPDLDLPAIRRALAECAAPPYMVNSRGPGMDGPPYELWHGQGLGGPVAEFQDYDEAECFALVVNNAEALLAEIERLRQVEALTRDFRALYWRTVEVEWGPLDQLSDPATQMEIARAVNLDAEAVLAALDAALGGGR